MSQTIEEYAKKHPKSKSGPLLDKTLDIINKLPKNSIILDVGCAEGNTIQKLYQFFGNRFRYFGIDFSETRINIAIEKSIENATFIQSDAQNIHKIESNTIDFVICSQLIEHVSDDQAVINEIHRVLKPDGTFQIDTVFKKKWAWYFYKASYGWAIDPTHLREYSDLNEIKKLFNGRLLINYIIKKQVFRPLNILRYFSFLPKWIKLFIPGYSIIYFIGKKSKIFHE